MSAVFPYPRGARTIVRGGRPLATASRSASESCTSVAIRGRVRATLGNSPITLLATAAPFVGPCLYLLRYRELKGSMRRIVWGAASFQGGPKRSRYVSSARVDQSNIAAHDVEVDSFTCPECYVGDTPGRIEPYEDPVCSGSANYFSDGARQ